MSKEKLATLKEKVEQLNKEVSDVYREGLQEYATDLLDKYTKIKGFSWTQYTPYFNDGEPCEFGINADYSDVLIEGADGEDDWHSIDSMTHHKRDSQGQVISWNNSNLVVSDDYAGKFTKEEILEIQQAIQQFASDALYPFERQLQALIGEGRVLLTRDGIDVEDYDHD